ncbi:MAG: tRNA dihydrouridine synthase DusB [Propionibacteriaceae bacterium]
MLAPMAGITTPAFRSLCREQGAGLYICEMITAKALVMGNERTKKMLQFAPNEQIRSVQLYGVDPAVMGEATSILCEEYGVDHVDLNFGCPVPKVTRKGGGGVLPWKLDRFRAIIRSVVQTADTYGVPVTVKTRIGIDPDHTTYIDAGLAAQDEGVAAVTLHGRTVAQSYGGTADWRPIADLVQRLDIPVYGNGDIWEADDALRMVEQTGCAGVVVGRGCLGRPWLFYDLAQAFTTGTFTRSEPNLGEVLAMAQRHGELLAQFEGAEHAARDLRKHLGWYVKGFGIPGHLREKLGKIDAISDIEAVVADVDKTLPFPKHCGTRGRTGTPGRRVPMPDGWLDDQCGLHTVIEDDAEVVGG